MGTVSVTPWEATIVQEDGECLLTGFSSPYRQWTFPLDDFEYSGTMTELALNALFREKVAAQIAFDIQNGVEV